MEHTSDAGHEDELPRSERRQRRRKTTLEMIGLVGPNAAAVFFSGHLVLSWTVVSSALWALFAGLVTAAYWSWHRSRFPANIDAPVEERTTRERVEMHEDAGPIWHPINLLVLGVGAVVVTSLVVIGVLVSFILPMLIIVGFGVADQWSDLGTLGTATLWTLGVAMVLEIGLVIPLSKLWGLSLDAGPADRDDFCPSPGDKF